MRIKEIYNSITKHKLLLLYFYIKSIILVRVENIWYNMIPIKRIIKYDNDMKKDMTMRYYYDKYIGNEEEEYGKIYITYNRNNNMSMIDNTKVKDIEEGLKKYTEEYEIDFTISEININDKNYIHEIKDIKYEKDNEYIIEDIIKILEIDEPKKIVIKKVNIDISHDIEENTKEQDYDEIKDKKMNDLLE